MSSFRVTVLFWEVFCQISSESLDLLLNMDQEINHRIAWVGRVIWSNLPAMSRDIFSYNRLLRATSSLTLNLSTDGASTISLGNLFPCFTTLIVKNFFLKSSLNLPC